MQTYSSTLVDTALVNDIAALEAASVAQTASEQMEKIQTDIESIGTQPVPEQTPQATAALDTTVTPVQPPVEQVAAPALPALYFNNPFIKTF
jgi:hypothetical protein